jgi:hypothetical protein
MVTTERFAVLSSNLLNNLVSFSSIYHRSRPGGGGSMDTWNRSLFFFEEKGPNVAHFVLSISFLANVASTSDFVFDFIAMTVTINN